MKALEQANCGFATSFLHFFVCLAASRMGKSVNPEDCSSNTGGSGHFSGPVQFSCSAVLPLPRAVASNLRGVIGFFGQDRSFDRVSALKTVWLCLSFFVKAFVFL